MNKILIFISMLFVTQLYYSQTKVNDTIRAYLFTKEFENLSQGKDLFETYPILKTKESKSIFGCLALLNIRNDEIKKVAIERLKGISIQLFNQGTPVLLIFGMSSGYLAKKENENLEDDNHIVYINIAECVVSNAENIAHDVFNEQTRKLINEKNPSL